MVIDPSMCTYEGKGIKSCIAGKKTNFQIIARDKNGNQLKTGGEKITIYMKHENGEAFQLKVTDLNNGVYDCEYMVEKTGNYKIDIGINNKRLKGCPFNVFCHDSGKSSSYKVISKTEESFCEGKEYSMIFQSYDEFGNERLSGGDTFKPQIRYTKGKDSIPIVISSTEVEDLNDGKYKINFKCPIKKGLYQLRLLKEKEDEFDPKSVSMEGFKPILLKCTESDTPKLTLSYLKMNKGTSVIQFKASEIFQNIQKDRFISIIHQKPINVNSFNKDKMENILREKWKKLD